ncbi:hypothetical protein MTR67_046247 [Solanum verrucosum]|uniref:Germin-like protein n=1 Tax=Solanum verrucosum TaxID=315347 RepID=A0AAF0ZUF2_SOLVR|nr:hypothetical protein MTR67_046247 [Solanum verrucosum]
MPSGLMCKNPMQVEANDFYYGGLNIPSNKSTPIGINMTLVNVDQLPGLNTLGISMARIDYALDGINPPHIHPRATENRLISRVIHTGDVFVFPAGLIHFQRNVGNRLAIALLSLSSQNPGLINIRDAEETLPESVKFK